MLTVSNSTTRQPAGTAALSPALAGLGFTHAWSWSDGPDLPLNRLSVNQLSIGAGSATATATPQGRGLFLSGSNTQRLTVGANPFATSTCTYLIIEALQGDGTLSQGQVFTDSRYSTTSQASNSGGLQFRKYQNGYQFLRSQQAVTLDATNCVMDGRLNAVGASVAGNNGRHAVIANGRLVASATPTSTYTHGTSAIGNSVYVAASQEVRMSGPLFFLAFAPVVVPDAALVRLTASPWEAFAHRRIWVPVNAPSASDVLITCTPGNAAADGVTAQINQARRIDATVGNAAADGVTAKIDQARRIDATPGNSVAGGVTAKIDQARVIAATVGNAVADGVNAQIITAGAVVIDCTPGNAVADGVTAVIDQARLITATPGAAVAAGVDAFVSNSSDVVITATPGDAVADGAQALLIQDLIIAAVAANAAAAGVNALIMTAVDTDDLYPLEGMSQDYPLQGMTQTYPLAGQTPS